MTAGAHHGMKWLVPCIGMVHPGGAPLPHRDKEGSLGKAIWREGCSSGPDWVDAWYVPGAATRVQPLRGGWAGESLSPRPGVEVQTGSGRGLQRTWRAQVGRLGLGRRTRVGSPSWPARKELWLEKAWTKYIFRALIRNACSLPHAKVSGNLYVAPAPALIQQVSYQCPRRDTELLL